eukprot:8404651-Ditylum_brightwellii.AAC.1
MRIKVLMVGCNIAIQEEMVVGIVKEEVLVAVHGVSESSGACAGGRNSHPDGGGHVDNRCGCATEESKE